jgi:uncharacterized protein YjiS (DUF1127 family)
MMAPAARGTIARYEDRTMSSRNVSRRDASGFDQGTLRSDRRYRLDAETVAMMIPGAGLNQAPAAPQRAGLLGMIERAFATLMQWRDRAYSRRELATFDRRMLRDIGVSPYDAGREINKPFWRE